MELKKKITEAFASHFGGEGTLYSSAGRINLIGEHTDYNGGFVFPVQSTRSSWPKSAPTTPTKSISTP